MYHKITESEQKEVLAYYGQDRKNCLYSYIDLKKYGLQNPHLSVYADRGPAGALRCVLLRYYDGINVFSLEGDLDVAATAAFLQEKKPSMINAPLSVLERLYPYFAETYEMEKGYVTQWQGTSGKDELPKAGEDEICKAGEEELPEIAALICTDEGVGGTYTPEGLAAQLLERQRDGFGRSFYIRRNGRIVCHAGTYAEVEDLAVVSGVITAADFRGQNLADRVVSKLNKELLAEGKLPCLFYYTESAARLYAKTGYAKGSGWAKLIRKQG